MPDTIRTLSPVLKDVLHAKAAQQPDNVFAHFPGDDEWTYATTLDVTQLAAACFHSLGVGKGDRALLFLPNGKNILRSWFGLNYLGAIPTPCNPAWLGDMLQHAIALTEPKVAVIQKAFLENFEGINLGSITDIIIVGGDHSDVSIEGVRVHPEAALSQKTTSTLPQTDLSAWDTMQMLFTSGTTGPSKAVVCSYKHASSFIIDTLPEHFDRYNKFLCVLPLFHAGGLSAVYAQFLNGGVITVPSNFSVTEFWPLVTQYSIDTTILLGAMVPFLLAAEPTPSDKDHSLKTVSVAPYGDEAIEFSERFGVEVWTSYGSTEIGTILGGKCAPVHKGATGYLVDGVEARLVDANDVEVAKGSTGELIARSDTMWRFFSNYHNNPSATVKAMRNGWYHTGDLMAREEDGLFRFKGRLNDAIRRRGENISPLEVEAQVLTYPGISEVVAYAVQSEYSEDEVMIAYSGDADDHVALVNYLAERMPYYMVPRHVRKLPVLPRNELGKVKTDQLRNEGLTDDSWDREAAGIKFTRKK